MTEETKIIKMPEPNSMEEMMAVPRNERRVKLMTKTGEEITCMINRTLVYLKQKFEAIARRQGILGVEWNGLVERMKNLQDEYQELMTNGASEEDGMKKLVEIDANDKKLEEVKTAQNKLMIEKSKICIHLPAGVTEDAINWEGCDEIDLLRAQGFFYY